MDHHSLSAMNTHTKIIYSGHGLTGACTRRSRLGCTAMQRKGGGLFGCDCPWSSSKSDVHESKGETVRMSWRMVTMCLVVWTVVLLHVVPVTSTDLPVSVTAMFTVTDQQLLTQALAAYKFQQPSVDVSWGLAAPALSMQSLLDNKSDFITTTLPPTISQLAGRSDIITLPETACAYAVIYRLDAVSSTIPIVLSRLALARIFRGNITKWNDPLIASINPLLTMPDKNITVVIQSSGGVMLILTSALSKFEPDFARIIGSTASPAWPKGYASLIRATSATLMPNYVILNDGAISVATIAVAEQYQIKYASVINKAGNTITPSSASANYALIELGSSSSLTSSGSVSYDLTDATGYAAYPIVAVTYLCLSTSVSRTTCRVREEVVKFWLWFYSSTAVKNMAANLGFATIPDVIMTERDIMGVLSEKIQCDGSYVSVSQSKTSIHTVGSSFIASTIDMVVAFYSDQDVSYSYSYDTTNTRAAYLQIMNSEVDTALLEPSFLTHDDLAVASQDLIFIPSFVSAVTPVFHFDTRVNTTKLSVHQLVLTPLTLALIFTGAISSWLDPQVIATNPDMPARFGSVDPTITVVLTRPASNAYSEPTGDAFSSSLAMALGTNVTVPNDWTQWTSLPQFKGRFIYAADPSQVETLAMSINGAIGYVLANSANADHSTDVSLVVDGVITDNSNANEIPCMPFMFAAYQDIVTNHKLPGTCWPLISVISFAVRKTYSGAQCTKAKATLNMIKWFQEQTDLLMASLLSNGIVPLSMYPPALQYNIDKLNSITCDGENILITYPVVWEMSSGISTFAYVFCALGLVLCLIMLALLAHFRHKTVFKSSSVVFLATTLIGVMILLGCGLLMGTTPSPSVCGGMAWTACLGFTIAFGPLFAKSWRIYRIFGRKALKVVKISNRLLAMGVLALVLVEVIILSIWQSSSPLTPITSSVLRGDRYHEYTQCSVDSGGIKYIVILISVKAALLIFGSLMAFSTRRVATTFNESQAIAWAIYNVVFSVCVIVPISVFTSAIGDALVLLMVFLVLWISYFTAAILFGPKLLQAVKPDEVYGFSENSSMRESSGGFSFLSASMMSKEILNKYITALKTQLKSAEQRLASFGGKMMQSGGASTDGGGGGGAAYAGGLTMAGSTSMISPNRKSNISTDDSPLISRGREINMNKGYSPAHSFVKSGYQPSTAHAGGSTSVAHVPTVGPVKRHSFDNRASHGHGHGQSPSSVATTINPGSMAAGGANTNTTIIMKMSSHAVMTSSPTALMSVNSKTAVTTALTHQVGAVSSPVGGPVSNKPHVTGFDEIYNMTHPSQSASTSMVVTPGRAAPNVTLLASDAVAVTGSAGVAAAVSSSLLATSSTLGSPSAAINAGHEQQRPSDSETILLPLLSTDGTGTATVECHARTSSQSSLATD